MFTRRTVLQDYYRSKFWERVIVALHFCAALFLASAIFYARDVHAAYSSSATGACLYGSGAAYPGSPMTMAACVATMGGAITGHVWATSGTCPGGGYQVMRMYSGSQVVGSQTWTRTWRSPDCGWSDVPPECEADEIRNSTTGACEVPPPMCSATDPVVSITSDLLPGTTISPQARICYSDCGYTLTGSLTTSDPSDPEDVPALTSIYSPVGELCGTGDLEPIGDVQEGVPGPPPPNTIGGEDEAGNVCAIVAGLYQCTSAPGNPGAGDLRCYRLDGYPTPCPGHPNYSDPSPRCDWVSNNYVCTNGGEHAQCAYVQGIWTCFPPASEGGGVGGPIPITSPDHPINGGNGNGNDRDDPTSGLQTPPSQSQVVDEQRLANLIGNRLDPGFSRVANAVTTDGQATRNVLGVIADKVDSLSDMVGNKVDELLEGISVGFEGVEDGIDGLQSELEVLNERVGEGVEGGTGGLGEAIDAIGNSIDPDSWYSDAFALLDGDVWVTAGQAHLPGGGACGVFSIDLFPDAEPFVIDLCELDWVTAVIAWGLSVLTFFACINMVVNAVTNNALGFGRP